MNDHEIHDLLRVHESAGQPRFASGFADRVMQRVAAGAPVVTLDLVLARYARRVLPTLAAASVMLAIWNYVSVHDRAPSTIGAVLGVASTSAMRSAQGQGASANGLLNLEAFE